MRQGRRLDDDDGVSGHELIKFAGDITQLTYKYKNGNGGGKKKRQLGFAVPVGGVGANCKVHPNYDGSKAPRNKCPHCRRFYMWLKERR